MNALPSNGLTFLVSYNSPRSISTISLIVFLTFALIRFSCAAKRFVKVLPQKSEQFFRGPVLQALAGIHLFHRPIEPASCGVHLGSESYYKCSSHGGELRSKFPISSRLKPRAPESSVSGRVARGAARDQRPHCHMDRPAVMFAWYWRMPLEFAPAELWLAKGDLAQARPQAESFLKIELATAEHTWRALPWVVNARLATAELDQSRAQVLFNHLQKSDRSQHLSRS